MDSLIKTQHAATTHKNLGNKVSGKTAPLMTLSEDNAMLKHIQSTHSPDAREVEVTLLLDLVEDVLNHATLQTNDTISGSEKLMGSVEDKLHQSHVMNILDSVSYAIDRIACEISYKALNGSDPHETTMGILDLLSHFHYDAKLVLTLSAFALSYGEFWLLVQIYSSNHLAKSLAMLKLVPTVLEHTGALKSKFEALNNLIREMLSVAKCVVEFRGLSATYIDQDVPELSAAVASIPVAVYWTIRSVFACVAQITMITSLGHEVVNTPRDSWELSTLAQKLKTIHEHLSRLLSHCHQHIERRRGSEALRSLHELFETTHLDNMRILKALIHAKDDTPPLVDGSTKKRVHLDVLRRKSVLLLVSDLNILMDELQVLEDIYKETRKNVIRSDHHHVANMDHPMPYEIVWIPIVDHALDYDRSPSLHKKFEALQATMPWYSVYHPRVIQRHVVEFIRSRWHFMNKPILVVLDPQGTEASLNALHMMWIWGGSAFPFTRTREEILWTETAWNLNLLADGTDQNLLDWIARGDYIFMFGGDDIEWIKRFTLAARSAAKDAGIPLQMIYVGKRNHSHSEKIKRINDVITVEKLSNCWTNPATMWLFWTRIESMLYSKIQLETYDEEDDVMQGIKKIISYDKSGCWAVLSRGAEIFMTGHSAIATIVGVYDTTWKKDVETKGFRKAMSDYYNVHDEIGRPCTHFDFHVTARSGRIPEGMRCAECRRKMEKYVTYSCCHEDKNGVEGEYNF